MPMMPIVFSAMAYYDEVYPEVIDCLLASKTPVIYNAGTRVRSTNIDLARSELAGRFLEWRGKYGEKATHMLCVDSDTWWQGDLITQLVEEDCDIILAAYVDRKPPFQYHIRAVDGSASIDDAPMRWGKHGRILEIGNAGIGCCLIKRDTIEKMVDYYRQPFLDYAPSLIFYQRRGEEELQRVHLFAKQILPDFGLPRAFGEDYGFQARATAMGFKIECLASAEMFHAGIPCCLERDVYSRP